MSVHGMHQFRLLPLIAAILFPLSLSAQNQEKKDSLVRLVSAQSLRQVEENGVNYRKVFGMPGSPATFLHNDTYLLCDTALWNLDTKVIEAFGNVKILQEETVLTGDRLIYRIDEDVAQFRGSLVQLTDRDRNTLRTRHLDYNTRDSVALFENGGAMRDKDGQIIESRSGEYDSRTKTFLFRNDVNMFTDSIFISTSRMVYKSDSSKAVFGYGTNAWKDDKMLSSNAGWYDRNAEFFCFNRDVHLMSRDQEAWCDSLFFDRKTRNIEMLGNVQLKDTTRNVAALAGRIYYVDSLSNVTMSRKPAVITEVDEDGGGRDTVYVGADTLIYRTIRRCDADSLEVAAAKGRMEETQLDPVATFRRKAAEEAAAAAEQAAADDPNNAAVAAAKRKRFAEMQKKASGAGPDVESVDSVKAGPGSEALSSALPDKPDSLSQVPVAPDTSRCGFATALHNVKIYRHNMQVVCDSLLYSDLDSMARLFKSPSVWNEVRQQFNADSIFVSVRGRKMRQINMMSDAFIHIQEDSTHFDQVRGTEMVAYFDDDSKLTRFDALGGASAIFFMKENDALATVNKKESKMLSASFVAGNIDQARYFDVVTSDAFPIVQLKEDEQKLKGFHWEPERRPVDRYQVTPLEMRASERSKYAAVPRADFKQSDDYFPGYLNEIYGQISRRDSLKSVNQLNARHRRDSIAMQEKMDSLARVDSIAASLHEVKESLAQADTARAAVSDSSFVSAAADSVPVEKVLSEKEIRQLERQRRDDELQKAFESKQAEKKARKEARQAASLRRKKLTSLRNDAARTEKENAIIEKYRQRYLKQKEKHPERFMAPADTTESSDPEND